MLDKNRTIAIELTEHQTSRFPANTISNDVGEKLWQAYDVQKGVLNVTFPNPKTNDHWEITPLGWVGTIPLTSSQRLFLQPKISLQNIFRMWEYAYQLQSIYILDNLITVNTVQDLFDHLANMLAKWAVRRGQIGLHRLYAPYNRKLPFLRGRLLLQKNSATVSPDLNCQFDEQSSDIPDNQILLFTLYRIAKTGLCRASTQRLVRKAYHLFAGSVSLRPFTPSACINRTYSRLNQDYQLMHALCRFFLDHIGPTHQPGEHEMKPFLINMPRLFEQFVAAWMKAHLPSPWQLQVQESVHLGEHNDLRFDIDLVLYDENGRSWAVLDTKYKTHAKPDPSDIHQIIAYANAKQAPQAILIYPTPLAHPLNIQLDDINIRTLSFSLDDNLQKSGENFLNYLHKANKV
ncbi:MAG: restriction endonuclease [Chloroflexi bacterium]|nr:MAG: restriction endonuclease [Chloroflexota bacterium]